LTRQLLNGRNYPSAPLQKHIIIEERRRIMVEKTVGKTAFQKIIEVHLRKTLTDGNMVFDLDWVYGHEITTPNAILDARSRGCDVVFNPNRVKTMIDHVNPAKNTASAVQGQIMRGWSKEHNIEFLEVGRNGVCHGIIPEKGWILPGQIGIMGDSHTCTHGAFGAFTAGVGTTDLEAGIITGLWICPPQKVIRVNFTGELPANVFSKDLILNLIKKIGVRGAINSVLEFGGPVIKKMSMDARMTMTNMGVEAGATSAMINVDKETVRYLWPALSGKYSSADEALRELSKWNSDHDCAYAQTIEIDVSDSEPMITRNYLPSDVVDVRTFEFASKKVDQVYIGSCTNGRFEDLQIAAQIFALSGQSVAEGVRCIIVPATQDIYNKAMAKGLLKVFANAGCYISGPTCGACLGMSCGVIAPGEVCVSTTNRNFEGRMGDGGMVHLASPATAAITAINGVISLPTVKMCEAIYILGGVDGFIANPSGREDVPIPEIDYASMASSVILSEMINFSGKSCYLPKDDVNTDDIIAAKHLTETDKEVFGKHCLEKIITAGGGRETFNSSQILITGENFGCGSSREHAPWALEAAGIRCVIAPSFARIFYSGMFNNGLLCIKLSEDKMKCISTMTNNHFEIVWNTAKDIPGHITIGKDSYEFPLSEFQKELIRKGGLVGYMLELIVELQET
jgi:3-isopropylmalate/(R)-2-methylmalate dehydratase large subunit